MKVIFKMNVEYGEQFIPAGTVAIPVKCKASTEENTIELRNTLNEGVINIPLMVFKVCTKEVL